MNANVDQEAFTRVLKRATLTSGASPNPLHLLVKIEAKKGEKNEPDALVISGVSGLMAINTSVKARVDVPGVVAANLRELTNASSAMPSGGIALTISGQRLRLKGSSGRTWSGAIADHANLQKVPEPHNANWARIPTDAARVGIERVGYATSNMSDECRAFDGVRFEVETGKLTSVCVSRYQCVVFEQQAAVQLKKPWSVVMPTMALGHFREMLDEADQADVKYLDIYEDGNFVYVMGPSTLFVAALPMGEYPPWGVMLSNFPTEPACTLPRLVLMESIKACLLTRGSKLEPGALFRFSGSTITVERRDKDSEFSDTLMLPMSQPGLNMTFKVGLSLLFDLLKGADMDPDLVLGGDSMSILARTQTGYRALLTLMNMNETPKEEAR